MDVKTRKTFYKKGSVARLYMNRRNGGSGLISVTDCVKEEELAFFEYVKASKKWMLMVVAKAMQVRKTKHKTLQH